MLCQTLQPSISWKYNFNFLSRNGAPLLLILKSTPTIFLLSPQSHNLSLTYLKLSFAKNKIIEKTYFPSRFNKFDRVNFISYNVHRRSSLQLLRFKSKESFLTFQIELHPGPHSSYEILSHRKSYLQLLRFHRRSSLHLFRYEKHTLQ